MNSSKISKSSPSASSSQSKRENCHVRQQYLILDESARNRRNRQQLDQLERDNFHDDPHANLVMHKKAPKFEENKGIGHVYSKRHALPRSRMLSFAQLLEEDSKSEEPNYASVTAPSPDHLCNDPNKLMRIPKRHFCSVCGFISPYKCINCGIRFCSINCLHLHKDTRCLKWTA